MQISLQPKWWRQIPLLGLLLVVPVAAWVFDPPRKPIGSYPGRVEAFLYVHKDLAPTRNRVRVQLDAGDVVQADIFASPGSLQVGDRVELVSYQSLLFRRITFEGKPVSWGGP